MAHFVNEIKYKMAEIQDLRFKQAEQITEASTLALK